MSRSTLAGCVIALVGCIAPVQSHEQAHTESAPRQDAGGLGSSSEEAGTQSRLDAGPVGVVVDASEPLLDTAISLGLPTIRFSRGGEPGTGSCLDWWQTATAELTMSADNQRMVVSGTRSPDGSRGLPSFPGEVMRPDVPFGPRDLNPAELRKLQTLLAAVLANDCVAPAPAERPSCVEIDLTIGSQHLLWTGVTRMDCDPYRAAAGRLATFFDGLGATDPTPDAPNCFSPTNMEHAFDEGAIGCACDWRNQWLCHTRGSLSCDQWAIGETVNGRDVVRWRVNHEPCFIPEEHTACPEPATETLEECLSYSHLCVGPENGKYCRPYNN